MERITVMVSPFYGGEEWTDEGTGVVFKQSRSGEVATYTIPADADLSGVRKAVRLNTLVLVSGSLEDTKAPAVKEEPKQTKEADKVVEEVKAEEVKVEEPKTEKPKAPAKKGPAKK